MLDLPTIPSARGKTVLRGGYGIYYDRIILEAERKSWCKMTVPSPSRNMPDRMRPRHMFPHHPASDFCFAPRRQFRPRQPHHRHCVQRSQPDRRRRHHRHGAGRASSAVSASFLGLQQQFGNVWLFTADGLHVFGERQLIGNLLRTTDSTSPDITCPGNNVPCTITDPLTGISDNITLIQSQAKSWYDGLLVSLAHRALQPWQDQVSVQHQLHALEDARLL